MLNWDIYEISSVTEYLNGVMLRGRIRKFGLENGIDILAENTEDAENKVRFAVLTGSSIKSIQNYLETILTDVKVELISQSVKNPVLSKLKVNKEERYTL